MHPVHVYKGHWVESANLYSGIVALLKVRGKVATADDLTMEPFVLRIPNCHWADLEAIRKEFGVRVIRIPKEELGVRTSRTEELPFLGSQS